MSIWSKLGEILSSPLGGMVYHLLLLLAVEAALAMAWGEWKRTRRAHAQRLVMAMIGLIALRAVYVLVALTGAPGWVDFAAIQPPLERMVDTASLALLGWAFVPTMRKRAARTWDWIFGLNLLLGIVVGVVFILLWTSGLQSTAAAIDYNLYWQTTVWTIWQIALLALAGTAAWQARRMGWQYFLVAMLVMFAGQLLQVFLLSEIQTPDLASWVRLANMVAYPLIAFSVYEDIVVGLRTHSRELQDISQASLDQIKSLLFLFEAGRQMSSSLDLSNVLDNAVKGIARALEADQCGIAFPDADEPGLMRLVAIYNPARQGRGEEVTFPLEYQLTVQQAMRRRKYVLSEETDNVQLKVLFALLGSSEVGPLLVQPLVAGEQVIGAVIVGNSRSRRLFTPNEAKLCESMAEQLVTAIQNVRRYQQARARVDELNRAVAAERRAVGLVKARLSELAAQLSQKVTEVEELSQREETAREARNALEIKLVTSRAEADALSKRLSVLETDLAQAHANAEAQIRWHEEELKRLETEWFQTEDDTTHWIYSVLQGMTVGVIIANGEGAIREANVAAEILLDQESGQIQQEDLLSLVEDERWKQAIETARRGEAVRLTLQVGPNILMCDVTPLPGLEAEQEEIKALVVVLQDISAEAGEQREQLEMISTMAEELRTPMTTIVNYVDLLLSGAVGDLAESQRKYLLRVKASVERMGQMTDDLAREASGEKRWNSPQRQSMDLRRFLERTVSGNSLLLEDKNLSLNLSLPENLPSVQADPDYLRRVMANLLSNACRASVPGGQIQVEAVQSNGLLDQQGPLDAADEGFVIVSIRDSGGGLSDDALNRVFDRRRPSGTPRGLGESGAGLALVKTLVEAHGGRLWIESEAGVGTTFSFVLPVNEWDTTAEANALSRAIEGNGAT